MAHANTYVLALLSLSTGCLAASSSVMRLHKASIQPGGEVEMMQTAESSSGLATIANMFSGDKEAKDVTSKLLMLAEGTPSDDLLPFIQKLKKQIEPWHEKSTATLKTAIEEVEACTEGMEKGMRETDAKKGSCSAASTSHTMHREDESAKFTSKEQAKAEEAEKKEEMTTECNAFKAVKDEVHSATASYGGGDEGAYLESVSEQFCSGLLPRFKDAKQRCTTATSEHTKASEIYETKNTAYTVQKSASDTVQTEMDVTCCEYALATKGVCTNHDTCYEDKVAAYKAVEAIIKGEEKIKKVEWRVYSRIECLLPVLGTDNAAAIDACREKEHSTSHLDIDYPKIPEKTACEAVQDFPGTEAYKNEHFGNLPENAKGKAVAVCAGMEGASISTIKDHVPAAPQGPVKLGCFIDDGNRAFAGGSVRLGKNANTVSKCEEHCSGKAFMAVQDGDECYCGDSYKAHAPYSKVADSQCSKNSACNIQYGCGNAWKNTIYSLPSAKAPLDIAVGTGFYGFHSSTLKLYCKGSTTLSLRGTIDGPTSGTWGHFANLPADARPSSTVAIDDGAWNDAGWKNKVDVTTQGWVRIIPQNTPAQADNMIHVDVSWTIGSGICGSVAWHLAPSFATACDYGTTATQDQCGSAVKQLASASGNAPGRSLQVGSAGSCNDGSWGSVPLGCSAQTGGDWAAHYKTSGVNCNNRYYQLVCSGQADSSPVMPKNVVVVR